MAGPDVAGDTLPPPSTRYANREEIMTNHIPHRDLPLPDFDHITTGDLAARIRGLDAGQIETLIEFERSHPGRLPIMTVLEQRLNQLADGAEPTGPVLDDSPTMNHGSAARTQRPSPA
jgi:hypothetical protein